jgi:hypothetical protein
VCIPATSFCYISLPTLAFKSPIIYHILVFYIAHLLKCIIKVFFFIFYIFVGACIFLNHPLILTLHILVLTVSVCNTFCLITLTIINPVPNCPVLFPDPLLS